MIRWARAQELEGRTPPIAEQARWLAGVTGIGVDGHLVEAALDLALRRSKVRVASGALRTLSFLRTKGMPLGLVSNLLSESGEAGRELLRRLRLDRYFGSIYLSCEHRWSKPSPEAFRQCLRELGARPDRAWHIGDHPLDIRGASAAGLAPVLYTGLHRYEHPGPRFTRSDLAQVQARFSSWREIDSQLRSS
jgi:putative hydrolase of the HAD superfamily